MNSGVALAVSLTLMPVLLSTGQVLFKVAGLRLSMREGRGAFATLTDPYLLVALGIYGVGTLLWVYVLSKLPLRTAYPVMALTFLLVPAACRIFLSESIAPSYWAGAGLVVVGVAVMTASA